MPGLPTRRLIDGRHPGGLLQFIRRLIAVSLGSMTGLKARCFRVLRSARRRTSRESRLMVPRPAGPMTRTDRDGLPHLLLHRSAGSRCPYKSLELLCSALSRQAPVPGRCYDGQGRVTKLIPLHPSINLNPLPPPTTNSIRVYPHPRGPSLPTPSLL